MTLLQGDCLEVLPTLADGSADMVFADLPYGVTACKWDGQVDLARLWPELLRVGKSNAAFVFTATMRFATALIASQPKLFRYDLVWDRVRYAGFLMARRMPMRCHEHVLVFYRQPPRYNAQKAIKDDRDVGRTMSPTPDAVYGKDIKVSVRIGRERHPGSILRMALDGRAPGGRRLHPTQKPVALLEWLIKTYSNPGDTILDPTAGSGTTAVAAIRTGRQYVCIERDPTYFDTMQRRVAEATAQAALPGLAPWEQHGRDTAANSAAASG